MQFRDSRPDNGPMTPCTTGLPCEMHIIRYNNISTRARSPETRFGFQSPCTSFKLHFLMFHAIRYESETVKMYQIMIDIQIKTYNVSYPVKDF